MIQSILPLKTISHFLNSSFVKKKDTKDTKLINSSGLIHIEHRHPMLDFLKSWLLWQYRYGTI